jgi:hypothetical protein
MTVISARRLNRFCAAGLVVIALIATQTAADRAAAQATDTTAPAPQTGTAAYQAAIRAFADSTIKRWIADPRVVDAVKQQNAKHAGLTRQDIDALDQQWRRELVSASHPLIDAVLDRTVSRLLLQQEQAERGLVTEIFIMDNKGLNVAQSDVTSDYWQGDEAKWQNSFLVGPDAIFIDGVALDESTQTFQSQVSLTITDPVSGAAIGAITAGIDIAKIPVKTEP